MACNDGFRVDRVGLVVGGVAFPLDVFPRVGDFAAALDEDVTLL